MKKINQFIDGKEYISKSERVCDVFNPAKGEKIGETSLANSDDINLVIQSAMSAKQKWASTPPLTRSRILFKFKELIIRDLDNINFIGADVVEVSPPFDLNNITSLVAATLAFEILCTMTKTN